MSFDPAADPRAFRDALGRYTTGVTVVTTMTADGPVAITANSFASVSLDPPLVLWSPAKSSRRFAAFEGAQHFAIHVLAAEDAALASDCAKSWAPFDNHTVTEGEGGTPLIDGVLARFECETHAQHDGGDGKGGLFLFFFA